MVVVGNIGCQEKDSSPKNPLVRAREKFYLRRWSSEGESLVATDIGVADRPRGRRGDGRGLRVRSWSQRLPFNLELKGSLRSSLSLPWTFRF